MSPHMRIVNFTSAIASIAFLGGFAVSPASAADTMPQLNFATYPSQVVWLVVSFVILYILMSRVALPRIGAVMEERQNKIDDNLARAEELKTQAEAAAEAYETALSDARAKAYSTIREVKGEALAAAAERQSALNTKLQKQIRAAEQAIVKTRDDALNNIQEVATDVTAAALMKLIGKAPGKKTVRNAVTATLKDRG